MKMFSISKFSTGITLALEIIADDELSIIYVNDRDSNRIVFSGSHETISYLRKYVESNTDDY